MHFSSLSSWRMTALLVVFGAATLTTPAQDPSQSSSDPVADAARKARAEQKKEPKPKKVFTNDDIPSSPAAASTPAPAGQNKEQAAGRQGEEAVTGKKEQAGDEKKKGEAYWRKRFSDVHQKIAETQQEIDILQKELNKNQVQYYNDPQKALMQQHDRSDINEKTTKIDEKKKELDALNQKLGDMEDELRKSGGDPGWAR